MKTCNLSSYAKGTWLKNFQKKYQRLKKLLKPREKLTSKTSVYEKSVQKNPAVIGLVFEHACWTLGEFLFRLCRRWGQCRLFWGRRLEWGVERWRVRTSQPGSGTGPWNYQGQSGKTPGMVTNTTMLSWVLVSKKEYLSYLEGKHEWPWPRRAL